MRFCHFGAQRKEEIGEKDVQQDGGDPDKGKLPGSVLVPQPGKGQGGEGFEADDKGDEGDVFGVLLQVYKGGDGVPEEDDEPRDQKGIEEEAVYKGVIEMGFGLWLLNIPEIGRIQGKHHNDIQEGDEGIDEAHFPIFVGPAEDQGEIRGQQIVEESSEDGAYSIPHRLPG